MPPGTATSRYPPAGIALSDAALAGAAPRTGIRYSPELDGLRTVAVAGVLYAHFFSDTPNFGSFGVRLFFVISGYLISHTLYSARDAGSPTGTILAAFYARRTLRIFPAYYAALGVAVLVGLPGIRETLGWHLFYATNVLFFLANDWEPWVVTHLWSLAVEEQFYLVWPFVVLLAPRRWLGWAVAATIPLAMAYRAAMVLVFGGAEYGPAPLVLMPAQLDALGAGALLAWAEYRGRMRAWWIVPVLVLGVVAAPFAINLTFGIRGSVVMVLLQPLSVCTFVALVLFARFGGRAATVLIGNRAMVWLGRRSYGIYLYHSYLWAGTGILGIEALYTPGWPVLLAITPLTIAVAALSWRYLEQPLLRLKPRFAYVRPPG